MKRFMVFLLCWIFAATAAFAEMITEEDDGALIIKKSSADEAKLFFRQHPYDYTKAGAKVPRVYFQHLPYDWKDTPENAARNRTFIRILLPLVLKINEEITAERRELMRIYTKIRETGSLLDKEYAAVNATAEKYDAFTTIKEQPSRARVLLKQLLEKVDIIPTSVMISTAIIYSDWGTSRLATEENSLYREEVWYTNQGVKPKDDPNSDYRYKVFSNLEDSIRARALHINSSIDYDYFRHTRFYQRRMNQAPNGVNVAAQMMHDSNLKNIGGMIDYTLSYYKLAYTDQYPQLVDYVAE